ncbi:MAG: hypothetical protein M0R17_09420 [Candidatus Omnitrophica bacterium]|jgi:hypothetical protein|nr:hypothetical protein [Candidatus Omnitrophota bacterium]
MKTWIIVIGIILIIFGFYPPFHLMSIVIGLIVAIVGMIIKNKKKEYGKA